MGSHPRVNVAEVALANPAAVASTLALDRGILAVPCPSGDVLIYNTHERDAPPEMLAGIHFSAVTALCFSWSPWPCLYTGAADGIARWSLEFVPAGLHDEDAHAALDAAWQQESELSSELLTTDLERAPVHVAVDVTGDRLAACVDCCTLIISCCSGKVLARLEGHHAPVSSAAFRSDHADSVITIGEDRRFIVYDLKAAALVYSSCIVSASPFISLAVADAGGRAAIGTSDGKVRLYDLATPDCRLLHTLDIPSATNTQDQPWLRRRYAPAPAADSDGPVPVSLVHARTRAYTHTHAHTHTQKCVEQVVITSEPAWKRALKVRCVVCAFKAPLRVRISHSSHVHIKVPNAAGDSNDDDHGDHDDPRGEQGACPIALCFVSAGAPEDSRRPMTAPGDAARLSAAAGACQLPASYARSGRVTRQLCTRPIAPSSMHALRI